MSPVLLASLLVVGLLALLPVWRLRLAGWPPRWLLTAWIVLGGALLLVVRFPGGARFLLPLLVLAYVAPFVAGPERLTRVLGGRDHGGRGRGIVVDVVARPALRPPPPPPDGEAGKDDAVGPSNGS